MLTPDDFDIEQLAAIDRLYDHDNTLLIAPKGKGKCVIGFTALSELLEDKIITRALVLAPAQVCTQTWDKEAAKWQHLMDADYVTLTGLEAGERQAALKGSAKIIICNFENLAWLLDEFEDHNFDALLVDEITKLKSVGGAGFKKLRKYIAPVGKRKSFVWRCGMTADPVAQESSDIYGQMLVIDGGKALGRNRDMFLRKYFMSLDFHNRRWEFQPFKQAQLAQDLAHIVYKVSEDSYDASLPELIDIEIPLTMPEDVRTHYKDIARDGYIMLGDTILEAPNEALIQAKLHQLANGSVYYEERTDAPDGGLDTTRKVRDFNIDKIFAVMNLVASIDTPVLIAYTFDFQRVMLEKKLGFPVFSAKNSKKVNDKMLKDWGSGDLKGMLVHPKSAGHGLNLQYGPCHTLICLSYLWSADEWDQLLGRLRRRGQASLEVTRYTLVCENTVEDCVMRPRLAERAECSVNFHDYLKGIKHENPSST